MTEATDIAIAQASLAKALPQIDAALKLIGSDDSGATSASGAPHDTAAKANLAAAYFGFTEAKVQVDAVAADVSPPVTPPPPVATGKPVWGGFHDNNQPSPVPQAEILDYADNNALSYQVTGQRATMFQGKRAMVKIGNCTPAQATQIAENLVAAGLANADIPIMWEDNQGVKNWEPAWSELVDTAQQFIALFLAIVVAMDAVPGAKFRYWWCPNLNQQGNQATGRNQLDTWPGVGPNKNIGIAPDGYDNPNDTNDSAGIIAQLAPFEALAKSAGAVFGGMCEVGVNSGNSTTPSNDAKFWQDLLPHAASFVQHDGSIGWLFVINFAATGAQGAAFNSDNGPACNSAVQAFYAA